MSTLYLFLQVLLATLLARAFYLLYLHPLARYPGPTLAALSNLWKSVVFFGGEHHLVEQKLHDQLGPVVRIGPNSLSFSSLVGFEAVYGYHKSIEKGDFYAFGRDAKTQAGSIFSARTDAVHRERRKKVAGPALSTTKVASYEPVVEKHVATLNSRLDAVLGSNSGTVNVAPLAHRFTFDTLNEIIYGDSISQKPYTELKGSSGILEGLRIISKMSWGCSLLPWFGRLMSTRPMVALTRKPTYDAEGNLTGIGALAFQTRNLILEHPEKVLESSSPSIVKSWLQVPESSSTRMDHDEMWREAFNLTFAGPGSSSAGLTSVFIELGSPEGRRWQDRIRKELSEGGGKAPSSSPSLTAVIKETLRLHAPFPTAFPRTIAAGAENALADVAGPLPVGTTVSSNTFILGQSKDVWGDDARVWKPQRWLGSDSKTLDDKFVAFSKGPRVCIGKDIVFLMITSAIASLLQEWEISVHGKVEAHNFLEMQYSACEVTLSRVEGKIPPGGLEG